MIGTAFLIAFNVLFVYQTFQEGMIFQSLAEKMYHWPDWIKKPLFDCPICMAPWWGALMMLTFYLVKGVWKRVLRWLLILFAAGGINTVLIYLIADGKHASED